MRGISSHFKNSARWEKKSSIVWASAPSSPERSIFAPQVFIASFKTSISPESPSHDSSVIMPSALKGVFAKILDLSSKSDTAMESAPAFPIFFKTSAAHPSSLFPEMEFSSISESFRLSAPSARVSGFFRAAHANSHAATTSSRLILPSLSASMKSSVFSSKYNPRVGQLRAAQSFMSSSPTAAMSLPLSMSG